MPAEVFSTTMHPDSRPQISTLDSSPVRRERGPHPGDITLISSLGRLRLLGLMIHSEHRAKPPCHHGGVNGRLAAL
ncbi:unnamed protein product [Boreogadus saida]